MKTRDQLAKETRSAANQLAASRPIPSHKPNGEETAYRNDKKPSHIANFTKGLPHDFKTGLALNPIDYYLFVKGIETGAPSDFAKTPLGPPDPNSPDSGPTKERITSESSSNDRQAAWESTMAKTGSKGESTKLRAWESAGAGHLFDLEGPDAQAVTMKPAPTLDSPELAIEIAEVYLQALLRDIHFSNLTGPLPSTDAKPDTSTCEPAVTIAEANKILENLGSPRTGKTLFRGFAKGDVVGPYLSQFLLIGNKGINDNPNGEDRKIKDGEISYGALKISQKVKTAEPCIDYLTTWESWYDAQNGADFRGYETYLKDPAYRFITTPRDLATYVHYDALYQAYLNACLIMLGSKVPFDPGIPYQWEDTFDKQQGFAHFGPPQILSLVCEVATRALKAVRFQKFNIHRRLRPEALAGRIHAQMTGKIDIPVIKNLVTLLNANSDLLERVKKHNAVRNPNGPHNTDGSVNDPSYLLPMAFPEGSPMHPSYGAGHATVAGACVTVLKAFFDHGFELGKEAYEPNMDGSCLAEVTLDEALTVEGELNKLAANISIGRDWAGVHYYSDYKESLLMGEEIAIGILKEQKLCYPETFHMDVPLFNGNTVRI